MRVNEREPLFEIQYRAIMEAEINTDPERVTSRKWAWRSLILILLFVLLAVVEGKGNSSKVVNSSELRRCRSTHLGLKTRRKLSKIHEHLRRINKPAMKSIQSPDGDIIDCIHQRKQPAFDHPLLKTHKIQNLPQRPSMVRSVPVLNGTRFSVHAAQTWHLGGFCPEGTIPVRRTFAEDLMRAESPKQYGRKSHRATRFDLKPDVNGNGHEHAIGYVQGEEYYGAKATMNVWAPRIETLNEFSLSQLWVLSGSFDGSDLNSIEAGWQVSPELYGDARPRLFTYWTSDSYQETGCYNLLCSGFVQTNNKIAIGAAISPVSEFAGTQYDITILIWKDPKEGNWWMEFADNTLVGYWPSELFTHLADHANMIEWGGEIVNTEAEGEHTSTQMGSGHFAEEGFGKASYFRNLEIVDSDNSLRGVNSMLTLAEHTSCYDIQNRYSVDWNNHFYFGGPGSNPHCH